MSFVLLRTTCEADLGTLCLLSCLWMTASNKFIKFLILPRLNATTGILCNLLEGALPYTHNVMSSSRDKRDFLNMGDSFEHVHLISDVTTSKYNNEVYFVNSLSVPCHIHTT